MTRASDQQMFRQFRLITEKGSGITLRSLSVTELGPDPQPNPARVTGLVVNGDHAAGSPTLAVRGAPLIGRFVEGDQISLPTVTYLVTGEAIASADTATLSLQPALAAPLTDGTALTPIWAADLAVTALVNDGGTRLPDGSLAEQNVMVLTISAYELQGATPENSWRAVLETGEERTVLGIQPDRVDGIAVAYDLMVR